MKRKWPDFTYEQIEEIANRALARGEQPTMKSIAAEYGYSYPPDSLIRFFQQWRHQHPRPTKHDKKRAAWTAPARPGYAPAHAGFIDAREVAAIRVLRQRLCRGGNMDCEGFLNILRSTSALNNPVLRLAFR